MGPPETKGKKRQAPQPAGEEEFVRGGGSGLAAIEKKRLEQVMRRSNMLAGRQQRAGQSHAPERASAVSWRSWLQCACT